MTLGELKDAIRDIEYELQLRGVSTCDIYQAVIRGGEFEDGFAERRFRFKVVSSNDAMEDLKKDNWQYEEYEGYGYQKERIDERVKSSPYSILFYQSNEQ